MTSGLERLAGVAAHPSGAPVGRLHPPVTGARSSGDAVRDEASGCSVGVPREWVGLRSSFRGGRSLRGISTGAMSARWQNGLVPAYEALDVHLAWRLSKRTRPVSPCATCSTTTISRFTVPDLRYCRRRHGMGLQRADWPVDGILRSSARGNVVQDSMAFAVFRGRHGRYG